MIVELSPEAIEDLEATLEHIERSAPVAALDLAERVLTLIERLAAGELDGPRQTLRSGEVVQSWPVPPVRIYCQRQPDQFVVLRIYHHARRPIVR
jgi:plasmid stabilization system protein ParE